MVDSSSCCEQPRRTAEGLNRVARRRRRRRGRKRKRRRTAVIVDSRKLPPKGYILFQLLQIEKSEDVQRLREMREERRGWQSLAPPAAPAEAAGHRMPVWATKIEGIPLFGHDEKVSRWEEESGRRARDIYEYGGRFVLLRGSGVVECVEWCRNYFSTFSRIGQTARGAEE
jgi:hypothetical protein